MCKQIYQKFTTILLGIILTLVSFFVSPPTVETEFTSIATADSIQNEKLRIIILTDFHYGASPFKKISDESLQQIVNTTNSLKPDIVALLGDFIDYNADPIRGLCTKWLSKLQSKYGTIAVLGNHDYKCYGHELIKKELQNVGITVLTSEKYYPIPNNPNFEVIGIGDISTVNWTTTEFNLDKAFEGVPKVNTNKDNKFRLVLSHNPKTISNFSSWQFDLQVSGHIHGGQIRTPSGYPILGYLRTIFDKLPSTLRFFHAFTGQVFNELGSCIRSSLYFPPKFTNI